MTPGRVTYEEGCRRTPGAVDPHIRLQELDEEGIDVAILYPTIGIAWERDCEDPELSAAYCRAYNNWLLDYCSVNPAAFDRGRPHQLARCEFGGGRSQSRSRARPRAFS